MNSKLLQGFYLGDLQIEPLKGRVTGPGHSARLSPRAMEVLMTLASSPGELVTHGEIMKAVWGVDGGNSDALVHTISDIRHALLDAPGDPHFIQTLPRRGYRLIPEPEMSDNQTSTILAATRVGVGLQRNGVFQSLLQRGVIETGIAYLVLGWLLLQIADVVFDQLLVPQWVGTFVTVLVIAAFPIVLTLSWFLEFRDGRAVVDKMAQTRTSRDRFGRTYLVIVSSLVMTSLLVYVYDAYVGLPEAEELTTAQTMEEAPLPTAEPDSIAVLPFFNISSDPEAQLFASGIAEDLINQLALVPGLSVASRGDAWSLGATSSSSLIRRRLRVAYYVEGSVRLERDSISVNVKLIDTETGFPIISRNFDEALADFGQVQRDLMNVILANLRVALPVSTQNVIEATYEESDVDAYVLYRRGKEIYELPRTTESLGEAIDAYEKALEFDPGYAAAHAGICNAHVELYRLNRVVSAIDRAERACADALNSNPRLFMVFTALGDLYWETGRADSAEEAYQTALAINPQDVQALGGLANVYRRDKRFDEAETLLNTAIQKQPGNWRAFNRLGSFLFGMGRYPDAANAYRQVIYLDPENFQARSNLGSALTMAGDFEQGRRVLEESLAIRPLFRTYSSLGVIYYFLGDFDKSVETHQTAVELSSEGGLAWLNLADSLHFAGRQAESIAAFERARDLSLATLSVNPSDIGALFTLAWSQHRTGDSDEALSTLDRGLRLEPRDPYGHYYEALIRYESGDDTGALDSLRMALEYGYSAGMLVAEPYLGDMRADERFHALIVESI